jgi:hypothetical protein
LIEVERLERRISAEFRQRHVGVRYDELAPMLLNEVQKEQGTITIQAEHLQVQDATIAAQAAMIASLERKVAEVDEHGRRLEALERRLGTTKTDHAHR